MDVEIAARTNAAWCDIVCRTHGVEASFCEDAWISARRTPALYPDAITLKAGVSVEGLVNAVDTVAPGCSIKDSFADLALGSKGFRVLLDAEWIHRPARASLVSVPSDARWSQIGDAHALRLWEAAWSAGGSPRHLFRTALLHNDAVAILGAYDGDQIVGGAIANGSIAAVGISNVFTSSDDLDDVWSGCVATVRAHFPDRPVVGYESGAGLQAARTCGFEPIGALRVWIADR